VRLSAAAAAGSATRRTTLQTRAHAVSCIERGSKEHIRAKLTLLENTCTTLVQVQALARPIWPVGHRSSAQVLSF
jgi:hypothetical protein